MKMLKRSLALAVVLAMMLSLFSFGVSAEGTTAITFAVKDANGQTLVDALPGDVVYIDVNVPTGNYFSFDFRLDPVASVTVDDITVNEDLSGVTKVVNSSTGVIGFTYSSGDLDVVSERLATIAYTIPSDATGELSMISISEASGMIDRALATFDTTAVAKIAVVEPYSITASTAEEVTSFAYGTTADEIVAYLNSNVTTVGITTDPANAATVASVVANSWEAPADYSATKVGAQVFTAELVADGRKVTNSAGVKAEANVTLAKIADPTVDAGITSFGLVVAKDGEGVETEQNAAAVAAAVAAELENKVTLKKGDITEVVTLDASAFVADAAVTNVGDTANVTITVPTTVTAEKFAPAQEVTVIIPVTVIPDIITDIKWELTQTVLTPSREVAVKLTYVGEEAYDYANALVTVIAKLNDEGEQTLDNGYVMAETAEATTISLGTVKDLYSAAKSGDVLKLTVTVNGSPVQVDVDENEESIVEAAFAITADGVAGGISGIPTGVGNGGTVKPVEPVDPEDPAVEPEDPAVDPEVPGTDVPGTPVAGLFEDVPADHWAADYIKQMKDMGVVSGKSATTFEPDATITRAEFVKMIAVAFGLEIGASESAFEDCGADDWYTPYVVAAAEAGYVNGISDTAFGANDAISRQDICTIIGRILGLTAEEAEVAFADIDDIADYALEAVKALANMGILKGYEDGTFAPTKNATRAEVCKILSSILAAITEEVPEEDAAEDEAVVEDVVEEEAAEEEAVVEEDATEEETAEEVVEEEVADEE